MISSRTAKIDGVTVHYLTAGHGPALISPSRVHANLTPVAAHHSEVCGKIHGHCARAARHRRFLDPIKWSGYEDGGNLHSCACQIATCR